jgi:hypothetical protein
MEDGTGKSANDMESGAEAVTDARKAGRSKRNAVRAKGKKAQGTA